VAAVSKLKPATAHDPHLLAPLDRSCRSQPKVISTSIGWWKKIQCILQCNLYVM
jgi:hypothetical protein